MSALDLLIDRAVAAGVLRVYKLGAVPQSPAYPYAVVSLGSPDSVGRMLCGDGWTDRRLVVQMFGRSLDSVEELATFMDDAFEDVPLTELPDSPFSWRELSTPPYRDPDTGGVLSAVHTYRFPGAS